MGLYTKNNMVIIEPKHVSGKKIIHPLFSGKHGMFVISANWCGHCKALAPVWKQFKQLVKNTSNYEVGAVDAVKYPTLIEVRGFPTIFVVSSSGTYKRYSGARDILSLVQYMCKQTSRNNDVCLKKDK